MKASLLLSRISEREAIHATRDEVDREVEKDRPAEPGAGGRRPHAVREGRTLGRIANHIQTDKTLSFLFEHARKTD